MGGGSAKLTGVAAAEDQIAAVPVTDEKVGPMRPTMTPWLVMWDAAAWEPERVGNVVIASVSLDRWTRMGSNRQNARHGARSLRPVRMKSTSDEGWAPGD